MKLIECYIENFGKLSSYSQRFSDGLNVITGNNGCGKTTLSVFIKSMLYGIDAKKGRGEDSDRKRYMPWQGGRFGGSLTFENNGKIYRIERTFASKASEDSFAIYDAETGAETHDFSENVGEELFGIDADGFERTVFLSEKKLAVNGSNHTVAAKLSNLVGVDGDMGNFDDAIDKLEKKEKHYRHRKGNGGIIGDIKLKISKLDSELISLDSKKTERIQTEKKLSEIAEKYNKAKQRANEIEKQKNKRERENEYLKKRESVTECEKEISALISFFDGKPPSRDEVRHYEKKKNEALIISQSSSALSMNSEENYDDYYNEINKHIEAIKASSTPNNANKSSHFYPLITILLSVISIFLGLTIHSLCFLVSLLSLPFLYFTIVSCTQRAKKSAERSEALSKASLFLLDKRNITLQENEIYPYLCSMKAEISAKKIETENSKRLVAERKAHLDSLTEEYTLFLSRYSLFDDNAFDEINQKISSYEALVSLREKLIVDCTKYATENGINPKIMTENSQTDLAASIDTEREIKELQAERFAIESKISALYDELSQEDVLKEKRLELCDALENATVAHKTTIKAAEHLAIAKGRLTSKYLEKMRSSFDSYMDSIIPKRQAEFTIDTDFSVKKTENGLTNKIEAYSLGTRELYSLISRFALVDALYEQNQPFIVLDDPFCHFDDEKCKAILSVTKKIAAGKQVIYLTCSDSRNPT